jgi:hypothetical protein
VPGFDAFSCACRRVFAHSASTLNFPAYPSLPPSSSLAESNHSPLNALRIAVHSGGSSRFLGGLDMPIVRLWHNLAF